MGTSTGPAAAKIQSAPSTPQQANQSSSAAPAAFKQAPAAKEPALPSSASAQTQPGQEAQPAAAAEAPRPQLHPVRSLHSHPLQKLDSGLSDTDELPDRAASFTQAGIPTAGPSGAAEVASSAEVGRQAAQPRSHVAGAPLDGQSGKGLSHAQTVPEGGGAWGPPSLKGGLGRLVQSFRSLPTKMPADAVGAAEVGAAGHACRNAPVCMDDDRRIVCGLLGCCKHTRCMSSLCTILKMSLWLHASRP